jgi:hypothetical protein
MPVRFIFPCHPFCFARRSFSYKKVPTKPSPSKGNHETPWLAQASRHQRTTPTHRVVDVPLAANKRDGDTDHAGPLLAARHEDRLYELV